MAEHLHIEDPRSHPREIVERLRQLLAYGAVSPRPDAKRPHFFEIEDGNEIFYVHVSPNTGHVTFLAAWHRGAAPEHVTVSDEALTLSARGHGREADSISPNC